MELYRPELMRGIVDVQRELAQLEEVRRSALRPVDAAAMAGLASIWEARAADIFGVGQRAAEVASGMGLYGVSKVAANLAESQRSEIAGLGATVPSMPLSVLDAGAAAIAKPYGQWKAPLMRWTELPLSEVVSAQLPSLARLVSEAVRPQLASASFVADLDAARAASRPSVELPTFEFPEIDLAPWSPYNPEDVSEAEPGPQQEEEVQASGDSIAPPTDPEVLFRRIEALEREVTRQRRPFVVRLGEKVVAGLLVRLIWEQTPVSDYTVVAIDKLEVVIDGVTYILPYIS
ncbi:hypothetical protein GBA65_02320 [Rubrobacter marinus]|uniref:Uncharacterized protein n=1 Tax=Rubrobacter marinus TaxID=2653852 RepID=A0A6G8PU96_9ACTN|nr:hypothetical protein [Rubrobacter marinus]QIN77531.1 hypothetical protein GBA65_02320 [Rubrobacter marinus]